MDRKTCWPFVFSRRRSQTVGAVQMFLFQEDAMVANVRISLVVVLVLVATALALSSPSVGATISNPLYNAPHSGVAKPENAPTPAKPGAEPTPASEAVLDMRITPVEDGSGGFLVKWKTATPVKGWIEYGANPDHLDQVAHDVRGPKAVDTAHWVLVKDVQPDAEYFFVVVADGKKYENHGARFQVRRPALDKGKAVPQPVAEPQSGPQTGAEPTPAPEGEVIAEPVVESEANPTQPSPDTVQGTAVEIDGWKFYTDTAAGISLKYPSSWILHPGNYIDSSRSFYEIRIDHSYTPLYRGIAVLVEKNSQNLDPKAFIQQQAARVFVDATDLHLTVENTNVAGLSAAKVLGMPGAGNVAVFVARGSLMYRFALEEGCCGVGVEPQNEAVFNEMLRTIEFKNVAGNFLSSPKDTHTIKPEEGARDQLSPSAADSFRYPLDGNRSPGWDYAAHPNWNGAPDCYYPTPWRSLYHAGEDWMAAAGTTVYAVADGTVSWYDPGYSYKPGRVVIVRHTLPDNSTIYSMYGHLNSVYVSLQNPTVRKGDRIGTVIYQDNNSHLHWEMRYFRDGSNLCSNRNAHPGVPGPGYTADHPDNRGYTHPSRFVQNHQGGQPPAAPSNLRATAIDATHIRLDWSDNSNNESGFTINNGVADVATVGANTTSYTVGGLAPGSYSCYHVRAFNNYGTSAWTPGWACATTPAAGCGGLAESPHPYADNYNNTWTLTNPDTNATSTRIHFSRLETESGWDYVYVRDGNNNQINSFTGNYSSGVWSGTVPGRTVKVQLTSDGSVTAWGFCVDRIETVSTGGQPPAAPSNLRATAIDATHIRLDWSDNSNNESGFTINNGVADVATVGANTTSYTVGGLAPGSYSCYHVRAFNNYGTSAWTPGWACATTPPTTCTDDAQFVGQSPYLTVNPGQSFSIYFEVRNSGTCTWSRSNNYYLAFIQGDRMGVNTRQELSRDVSPNSNYRWNIDGMTAPFTPGTYQTWWRVTHNGNSFGPWMYIQVTVVSISSGNLAQNKPSWATSQESSAYEARYGNDGNMGTRWSSQISSSLGWQWYKVDLGSAQAFNRFVVRWEAAYGARYWVAWCDNNCTNNDNSNWSGFERWLSSRQDDVVDFNSERHRYVGVLMIERAPRMNNYSIWEFEVYNRTAATMSEVLGQPQPLPSSGEMLPGTEPDVNR